MGRGERLRGGRRAREVVQLVHHFSRSALFDTLSDRILAGGAGEGHLDKERERIRNYYVRNNRDGVTICDAPVRFRVRDGSSVVANCDDRVRNGNSVLAMCEATVRNNQDGLTICDATVRFRDRTG